jgi:hypothetical protein
MISRPRRRAGPKQLVNLNSFLFYSYVNKEDVKLKGDAVRGLGTAVRIESVLAKLRAGENDYEERFRHFDGRLDDLEQLQHRYGDGEDKDDTGTVRWKFTWNKKHGWRWFRFRRTGNEGRLAVSARSLGGREGNISGRGRACEALFSPQVRGLWRGR